MEAIQSNDKIIFVSYNIDVIWSGDNKLGASGIVHFLMASSEF